MGGGLHGWGFLWGEFLRRGFLRGKFLGRLRLRLRRLNGRDDTTGALRHSIFPEGISLMIEDPRNITLSTPSIMVARYLERCGDHACKISENLHYMETGRGLRYIKGLR
jgi:phosphate uptake regulator